MKLQYSGTDQEKSPKVCTSRGDKNGVRQKKTVGHSQHTLCSELSVWSGFWKSKQSGSYVFSSFFFLEFNHAWPAALRVCSHGTSSMATVVHALRRWLVATSPSTTCLDICHYDASDEKRMSNSATKLAQRSHLNCVLNPKVEIQSSNERRNWFKYWGSGKSISNRTGSNRQNSNVSCWNATRSYNSN